MNNKNFIDFLENRIEKFRKKIKELKEEEIKKMDGNSTYIFSNKHFELVNQKEFLEKQIKKMEFSISIYKTFLRNNM